MKKYWAAAVVICALLPLGYWFMSNAGGATPESLFADNFKAEDVSPQVVWNRGSGTPEGNEEGVEVVPNTAALEEESRLKALLTNGIKAYNDKSYPEAISYFEEYLKTPEKIMNSREVRFYVGVSYLAQNQTAKAKEIFKDLCEQPLTSKLKPFIESSQWYLALTLLKEGEVQQAKKTLDENC